MFAFLKDPRSIVWVFCYTFVMVVYLLYKYITFEECDVDTLRFFSCFNNFFSCLFSNVLLIRSTAEDKAKHWWNDPVSFFFSTFNSFSFIAHFLFCCSIANFIFQQKQNVAKEVVLVLLLGESFVKNFFDFNGFILFSYRNLFLVRFR